METEGLHAEAAQSERPREATCERLWSNAQEGKKGNLHRRAATRGGMRGGARRVRWGTAPLLRHKNVL